MPQIQFHDHAWGGCNLLNTEFDVSPHHHVLAARSRPNGGKVLFVVAICLLIVDNVDHEKDDRDDDLDDNGDDNELNQLPNALDQRLLNLLCRQESAFLPHLFNIIQ